MDYQPPALASAGASIHAAVIADHQRCRAARYERTPRPSRCLACQRLAAVLAVMGALATDGGWHQCQGKIAPHRYVRCTTIGIAAGAALQLRRSRQFPGLSAVVYGHFESARPPGVTTQRRISCKSHNVRGKARLRCGELHGSKVLQRLVVRLNLPGPYWPVGHSACPLAGLDLRQLSRLRRCAARTRPPRWRLRREGDPVLPRGPPAPKSIANEPLATSCARFRSNAPNSPAWQQIPC